MSGGEALYLNALFGAEPAGGLAEVRHPKVSGNGWDQHWFPCEDRAGILAAVRKCGHQADTYLSAAPRRIRIGRTEAVERVHVLWFDADGSDAVKWVQGFRPRPSFVVRTGTGDNVHGYWALQDPIGPDAAKTANRRLALAGGGDAAAVSPAQVLRPPGSFNHKGSAPVPVVIDRMEVEVFHLDDVVGHLPQEEPPRRSTWSIDTRTTPRRLDPLLAIPPAVYVEALTGREVSRDGKVLCPFHDERTASLHAYRDPEQGYFCFGCQAGGDIYNFAARLWNRGTEGSDFIQLRKRLLETLLGRAA